MTPGDACVLAVGEGAVLGCGPCWPFPPLPTRSQAQGGLKCFRMDKPSVAFSCSGPVVGPFWVAAGTFTAQKCIQKMSEDSHFPLLALRADRANSRSPGKHAETRPAISSEAESQCVSSDPMPVGEPQLS